MRGPNPLPTRIGLHVLSDIVIGLNEVLTYVGLGYSMNLIC